MIRVKFDLCSWAYKQVGGVLDQPMETLTIDKCEEYIGYAEQCLKLAGDNPDRELRGILREMAAEWLRLIDTSRIWSSSPRVDRKPS